MTQWQRLAWTLLLVAGMAPVHAMQAGLQAEPVPRDPEFGVQPRNGLGLERRVRMYQWRNDGRDYARAWLSQAVDSSGFAAGYDNPPQLPLPSRRWIAERITFEGKPLAPEVIAALGRWQPMRPDFAALPGNMATTFQPEGDGLGSAENPRDPQIGDLRIRWYELALPPLDGRLHLRDGVWQLAPADRAAVSGDPAREPVSRQRQVWLFGTRWWWLGGAALVLLLGAWWLLRRRR